MNQRSIMTILLIVVALLTGGIMYSIVKDNSKIQKMFQTDPKNNWKWEDNWPGDKPKATPPVESKPKESKPEQPKAEKPKVQVLAGSYKEALEKSGEQSRPVLAIFTAEWCGYCKKLKSETLTDKNVIEMMKNYVLVYVDTDKDREGVKKFNVTSLPTYVITNVKEEKLKQGSGMMAADPFAKWLNEPNMFKQPKKPS